jgi:hypothetical protein
MFNWWSTFSYTSISIPQVYSTFDSANLAEQYLRIDLYSPTAMDDPTQVDNLIDQGKQLA